MAVGSSPRGHPPVRRGSGPLVLLQNPPWRIQEEELSVTFPRDTGMVLSAGDQLENLVHGDDLQLTDPRPEGTPGLCAMSQRQSLSGAERCCGEARWEEGSLR